jgi:protease IV
MSDTESQSWERQTINKMLEMTIKEQRAKRRWSIFFKLCVLGYIVILTMYMVSQKQELKFGMSGKPYTAVINIDGEIAADGQNSAEKLIPAIRAAFADTQAKAIMLRINSPGGSPVQVQQIYSEIEYQKTKHQNKKLYAVIEDAGASGGYWLACAAHEIYADRMSIVGSIGVILSSFGAVDAMQKLGIERRAYYAGDNKDMLDPFAPRNPKQDAMVMQNIQIAHQLFIDLVKKSRGDRLKATEDMFSGRFWLGAQVKDIGLIDDFGDPYTVARDVIKAPELVEFNTKESIFNQLSNKFSKKVHGLLNEVKLG